MENEVDAMKDVMGLLETEPSESDHREQLAILVASGNCKEMIGVQLTQEQIKRLSKKDVEKFFNVMRLRCLQRLAMQLLIHLFNSVAEVQRIFFLLIGKSC